MKGLADRIAESKCRALIDLAKQELDHNRHNLALEHLEAAKDICIRRNAPAAYVSYIEMTELGVDLTLVDQEKYAQTIKHLMTVVKPKYERLKASSGIFGNIGNSLILFVGALKQAQQKKHNGLRHIPSGKADSMKYLSEGVHIASGKTDFMEFLLDGVLLRESALEMYTSLPPIYGELERQAQIARSKVFVGVIRVLQDRSDEALGLLEDAKRIYEKVNLKGDVADVNLIIGESLNALDRYQEAITRFKSALDYYKDLIHPAEQSMSYRGIGWAAMNQGNLEYALQNFNKSYELSERIRVESASAEFRRLLKEGNLEVSNHLCAIHLMLWERDGDSDHLREALNNMELAKCTSVAESLEVSGENTSIIDPGQQLRTQLLIVENKLFKTEEEYSQRIRKLKEQQENGQITQAELEGSLAKLQKDLDAAYEEVRRGRSAVLLNCVDAGSTRYPRVYNVLMNTLEVLPKEERWAILEFVVSSSLNKLIVFLVNKDGSIQHAVHREDIVKIENIATRCHGIYELIRNYKLEEANRELEVLSKVLYKSLIPEEIGQALKSLDVEHLMIVPHKFMHWVPFEVLFDGDNYWGLKYATSNNLSLDIVRLCIQKPKKEVTTMGEKPSFLFVKNPLCDLPAADEEVDSAVNLLESRGIHPRVLSHEASTEPVFREAANIRPLSVLHFSGHAVFMGKDPNLSHLRFHTDEECPGCSGREREHMDDVLTATEFIHDVKLMGSPIVYLSACETGITDIEPGDETFGLARALMYSGATTLVMSRWNVLDQVAPIFAKEFYNQLAAGKPADIALKKARQTVFNDKQFGLADWSVFFLLGDPFRRLPLQ